jgi:hypothetical protein
LKIKEVFEMLNFDSELIVRKYFIVRLYFGCYPILFEKWGALGEPVAVAIFGVSALLHFRLATDYTSSLVPSDA